MAANISPDGLDKEQVGVRFSSLYLSETDLVIAVVNLKH